MNYRIYPPSQKAADFSRRGSTEYAVISETYRSINDLEAIIFHRDKHELTIYISNGYFNLS